MITKHVSLWYNIIYNMIKLLDNYLFYFAKICLKYTSSNVFWIVLLNKNLRTFWGWFVIKHPINKNSISLTSKIVCSYMQVFTVCEHGTQYWKSPFHSTMHIRVTLTNLQCLSDSCYFVILMTKVRQALHFNDKSPKKWRIC